DATLTDPNASAMEHANAGSVGRQIALANRERRAGNGRRAAVTNLPAYGLVVAVVRVVVAIAGRRRVIVARRWRRRRCIAIPLPPPVVGPRGRRSRSPKSPNPGPYRGAQRSPPTPAGCRSQGRTSTGAEQAAADGALTRIIRVRAPGEA